MPGPEASRILVVDDEPAVCAVLARALREAGYEVETAIDGKSGLKLAQAGRLFSLVITNSFVGGVPLADFTARMRDLFPNTPILHLDEITRYTPPDFSPEDSMTLYQPFSLAALRMAVRSILTT